MVKKLQKLNKKEKEAYSLVGRVRGRATLRKHGKKHFSEIGKKGAVVRWKGHKKK